MHDETALPVLTPAHPEAESFTDAIAAVARLEALYTQATTFLAQQFNEVIRSGKPAARIRAFYPEIRLTTTSHVKTDSRLSFGHVAGPGTYSTTVTRPDLFRNYLTQQLELLIRHHGQPIAPLRHLSDPPGNGPGHDLVHELDEGAPLHRCRIPGRRLQGSGEVPVELLVLFLQQKAETPLRHFRYTLLQQSCGMKTDGLSRGHHPQRRILPNRQPAIQHAVHSRNADTRGVGKIQYRRALDHAERQ